MKYQIADNIRKIRVLKNYTQQFMAQELGISQKSYSNIENNVHTLSMERFLKIASILEVTPAELLNFNGREVMRRQLKQNGRSREKAPSEIQLMAEREKKLLETLLLTQQELLKTQEILIETLHRNQKP